MAEINTPSNLQGLLKFVYSNTKDQSDLSDNKRKKTAKPMFMNLRQLLTRISGTDYLKPLGHKE